MTRRCFAIAVLALLWLPGTAGALTGCWVTGPHWISLGGVTTAGLTRMSHLTVECSSDQQHNYGRVCIGMGSSRHSDASGRYLLSEWDGAKLHFEFYSDAAHTQIWGTGIDEVVVDVPMSGGRGTVTVPFWVVIRPGVPVRAGNYYRGGLPASLANGGSFWWEHYDASPPACAPTHTDTFGFDMDAVGMAGCWMQPSDLDFGQLSELATAHTGQSTISVNCSSGVPYSLALNAGNGSGASVADRYMTRTGGTETLHYRLYSNEARTNLWGDGTSGTTTLAGTGQGGTVPHIVYGTLLPRTPRPPSGQYSDTIIVTMTY